MAITDNANPNSIEAKLLIPAVIGAAIERAVARLTADSGQDHRVARLMLQGHEAERAAAARAMRTTIV